MNLPVDESKVIEIRTQLSLLTRALLDAIETGDRPRALVAQQEFTGTIATLWNATEEIGVDPGIKAILRLVAGWAMKELPAQIQDPVYDETIRRELKIFQRSLTVFR
jgi:hypothetical protein